jgi:hypothetical protein
MFFSACRLDFVGKGSLTHLLATPTDRRSFQEEELGHKNGFMEIIAKMAAN